MTFISLPIGSLTLDTASLITGHPALMRQIGGHALAHTLYSHLRHYRKRGVSRRLIRKYNNRKRRRFVDNIIMHHKRLHNRNRAIVISNARSRAAAKRNLKKKETNQPTSLQRSTDQQLKWRSITNLKERGTKLRGYTDAKRSRARSRWLSITKM